MSEVAEKEIEVVAGTISAVTQKKPDTWQVEVKPEGSQYAKKLWTKDKELVSSLSEKLGQAGAFVCHASYWTNQSGAEVRSLWVDAPSDGTETSTECVATPVAAPKAASSESLSKDEWARKDSAADKRACIAIAVSALTHTMPAAPTPEDLAAFVERVKYLSSQWHVQVNAVRGGSYADEDVPF